MPTFYGSVKDQLPLFLQKVAAISDSEADADMLILGTLAAISACLPNIYAIFGDDTIASVRRLAVSTCRIAMILTALRMMEDCDFSTLRYVRDDDYATAMTISSVLQQHMLRVISELPKKTAPRTPVGQTKDTILLQTFWDNLPDEFEAKDFKEDATSIGLTIPTAERYIRAWTGTRLERVMKGKYRKCKRV